MFLKCDRHNYKNHSYFNFLNNNFSFLFAIFLVLLTLSGCQTNSNSNNDRTDSDNTNTEVVENKDNSSGETSPQVFKLGILSIDSAVSVKERYTPLIKYLQETTGYQFELVSLTQETQFSQVENKTIDFATTNPLSSVQIQRLYDTEFLVTHSRPNTKTQFSGLIVVNANSDIQTVEDLKGKNGACVNFQTAAGGCTFQIYHLLEKGINPQTDSASFVENKSQDNIVLGVLNGSLDFGFIRTGQLEKMQRKGLIEDTNELRILEPIADDFFYTHTTALYPEWPIANLTHVDPKIVEEVKTALLAIPDDHPALKAIGIEEFVAPVDYSSLENLIETLKLKTWDAE